MPVDAVDLSARRQQFIPLTIAHLGNAGTATDGFEDMFTEAAQHAAQHLDFGSSLDPELRDANFAPGQIVESALGPTARDYENFAGVGGLIIDKATTAAGNDPTTQPTDTRPLSVPPLPNGQCPPGYDTKYGEDIQGRPYVCYRVGLTPSGGGSHQSLPTDQGRNPSNV